MTLDVEGEVEHGYFVPTEASIKVTSDCLYHRGCGGEIVLLKWQFAPITFLGYKEAQPIKRSRKLAVYDADGEIANTQCCMCGKPLYRRAEEMKLHPNSVCRGCKGAFMAQQKRQWRRAG